MKQQADFELNISKDEMMKYYSGLASVVKVQTFQGFSLQFPAMMLRRFMGPDGIKGRFQVRYSKDGKIESFERWQSR